MSRKYKGNTVTLWFLLLFNKTVFCINENCKHQIPVDTDILLRPDNRFAIDIEDIGSDNKYIPNKTYKVKLYSHDNESKFIAFTISARGDDKPNDKNPRKPIPLQPGIIRPPDDSTDVMSSTDCENIVFETNVTPKTKVEAMWKAPPEDHKCVTIYAMVAEKPDVWYRYDNPLSKKVCEDRRKADDMPPQENDNCSVCDDARYLLTFQGMWSYNTHLEMYPKNFARFSDIVGASHSRNFNVFKENTEARPGLKMLAEQGNTTQLEIEIQNESSSVRTIIRATAPPKSNMSTSVFFRTSRTHHVVSLVSAILPSPDWFVGVSSLELCEYGTNEWAKKVTLNIYPMDAGTDSGIYFDAANEETSPPRPISPAFINHQKEQTKPFARLQFDLIRTYHVPHCTTVEKVTRKEETFEETTVSSGGSDVISHPDSHDECPMTAWEEWPCEGDCVDNKIKGMHTRMRYHLVDNVVWKYIEIGKEDKTPSEYCFNKYNTTESEPCEEPCEDGDDVTFQAQRRMWKGPISPGQNWRP